MDKNLRSTYSLSVRDILLWKDVKTSGALLGLAFLAWYFIDETSPLKPSQLIALAVLILTAASLAWSMAAPLLKR